MCQHMIYFGYEPIPEVNQQLKKAKTCYYEFHCMCMYPLFIIVVYIPLMCNARVY